MANGYGAKVFINAIPGSGGIISTIAERVGCSWNTAKKYITEYSTVQEAYLDECERVNDIAESAVITAMESGDVASAKWWLTKKRKQSFGDAIEITGNLVFVNWDDDKSTD